jgi:hypothetical protein
VSVAGAGSCVIDAGGSEEVNKYLELCLAFDKTAYFLYDLDSLFLGNLRSCVKGDDTVTSFLATLGLGGDFAKYCGELDRTLYQIIKQVRGAANALPALSALCAFFNDISDNGELIDDKLQRARVALLVQIDRDREAVAEATSLKQVEDIEGRLKQIANILKQKNILLLPGGALEHHLPSYTGDPFVLSNEAKRNAVNGEVSLLAQGMTETEMRTRYGALFDAISLLPGKENVDIDKMLTDYLSKYIHDVQSLVVKHPTWNLPELQQHLTQTQPNIGKLFTLQDISRGPGKEFNATIRVYGVLGEDARIVRISQQTNAGMRDFNIESI